MTYNVTASVALVAQHAPDFSGQPDKNSDFDCGESDVKAVAQPLLGLSNRQAAIMLDLEVIRAATIGYANSGPTTPDHLQLTLAALGIGSTLFEPQSQAEYLYVEWKYLVKGLPLIALRRFETPAAATLHYCAVSGQTDSTCTVMDSWTTPSQFLVENYAHHWAMAQTPPLYAITLLGVDGLVS